MFYHKKSKNYLILISNINKNLDKTGFYTSHPESEGLMQQIADDLAYYIADMGHDEVSAGEARATVNFDPFESAVNPVICHRHY